ncbi:hypothetical protein YC2023_025838 [Brassica napus]
MEFGSIPRLWSAGTVIPKSKKNKASSPRESTSTSHVSKVPGSRSLASLLYMRKILGFQEVGS